MKTFISLTVLLFVTLLAIKAEGNGRAKRWIAIYEFRNMIKCATGRSALSDYDDYGCWCGIGGSGRTVDATDRCCKNHDKCYQALVNDDTCNKGDWFWKAYKRVGCTGCSLSNIGCGKQLCYCDRQAANCFSNANFNHSYKGYRNKEMC